MAPVTRRQATQKSAQDILPLTGPAAAPTKLCAQKDAYSTARALSLASDDSSSTSRRKTIDAQAGPSDSPAVYTIDLSLPPELRYTSVALEFQDQLTPVLALFDEIVESCELPISMTWVKRIARLFLRRVHDTEQTRELRGISKALGIEMYLLVAFNVLLDVLMGCTSGGVRIGSGKDERMVHFRSLDWAMDELRRIVVQLEYVERKDGPVIARSMTYVGFVGILTGVREGLSLSLNFRAVHNNFNSRLSNCLYNWHQLAVLLGWRASIASTLRHLLIPAQAKRAKWVLPTLSWLRETLPSLTTTACYLIFCDGKETLIIEKDRVTGAVRTSDQFEAASNHDVKHEQGEELNLTASRAPFVTGITELVEESVYRKDCLLECYQDAREGHHDLQLEEVARWMRTYPVLNECTHCAVIMDPREGKFAWARRWEEEYIGESGNDDSESDYEVSI